MSSNLKALVTSTSCLTRGAVHTLSTPTKFGGVACVKKPTDATGNSDSQRKKFCNDWRKSYD